MDRRREEFWHTRTSGSPHVWSMLRMAAEAMLGGEVDTANAIVEAGGVMTPNGTLALCYDELGATYEVPMYAYSDPANLTDKVESDKAMKEVNMKLRDRGSNADDATPLNANFRVAPGESLYRISIRKSSLVLELKAAINAEVLEKTDGAQDVPVGRMRLIWWGREMQDDQTLLEAGLLDEQMIQVYLRPERVA